MPKKTSGRPPHQMLWQLNEYLLCEYLMPPFALLNTNCLNLLTRWSSLSFRAEAQGLCCVGGSARTVLTGTSLTSKAIL